MTKILAGIVLYNPDVQRLQENVSAIAPQVECLVFIDNASKNMQEVNAVLPANSVVIHNDKNLGIATALNEILQYALDNDYDWALTLDQDTIAAGNMIEAYSKVAASNQHLGVICCKFRDRHFVTEDEKLTSDRYVYSCITSASMVYVKAWQEVGGFDDTMFIDSVDHDFCHTLWRAGWGVYKTIETEILQEIGSSTHEMKILGRQYKVHGHSTFRYYYLSRNKIYEARKTYNNIIGLFRAFEKIFMIYLVWRYEQHKVAKTAKIIKGAWDGLTCPIAKPTPRVKSELKNLNGGGVRMDK